MSPELAVPLTCAAAGILGAGLRAFVNNISARPAINNCVVGGLVGLLWNVKLGAWWPPGDFADVISYTSILTSAAIVGAFSYMASDIVATKGVEWFRRFIMSKIPGNGGTGGSDAKP